MRKIGILLLLLVFAFGCAKTHSTQKEISTTVSGEMLFSGPNSLQAPLSISALTLAEELKIDPSKLKRIGVTDIQISLAEDQVALAESLLLQIVSNNNEMTSLGTLSPLTNGTTFDLQVAEDIDLLPFLEDEGATWVLDVNLSEDIMEEMQASASLNLSVNYKN